MKSAQVFPSWISTAKTRFGDIKHVDGTIVEDEKDNVQEGPVSGDISCMKAPRTVYKGHLMPVRCVSFLVVPDTENTLVFSGGEDKLVIVWSLKTGEKVAQLEGHSQRVTSLSTFSVEGFEPLLISASWDERIRLWPLKDCLSKATASSTLSEIKILSEAVSTQSTVLKGHVNRIFSTTVIYRQGDRPSLASGSSDNTIRIWSLPDGALLHVLEDDGDVTWNLCISSWYISSDLNGPFDGSVIISGCKNSTVRIWQHSVGKSIARTASIQGSFSAMNGSTRTRRTSSGDVVMVLSGHSSGVHSLAPFDYRGEPYVATVCKDLDIRIFSLLTGEITKILKGHKNYISSIAVLDVSNARGGAIIISGSRQGANMRVWKYSTGEMLRFFNGHTTDINEVAVFPSPNSRSDDLVILSASRDTTMRSWLFAEEKALKVLDHGHKVKIMAMDVFHSEGDSLVVTGTDDGSLRAWRTKRNEGDEEHAALMWKVPRAHTHLVLAVCVYTPLPDESGFFSSQINKHWPEYLNSSLVLSASRNGYIRVSSILTGEEVVPAFPAHDAVITSLCTCSGARSTIHNKAVDPFLVSGSEDNTAIVWSMVDFTKLRVLEGHVFDVTSIAVHMPRPVMRGWEPGRLGNPASRLVTPREGVSNRDHLQAQDLDPIIITGSMDQTVRFWKYSSGEELCQLDDADSHITCVTCVTIDEDERAKHKGPIVMAGDGYGIIWVWSLTAPYNLIYSLEGHSDEVRSVYAYKVEGQYPIMVSGSLDFTVKVWNLSTLKLTKTIEGHTADVSAVRVFNLGGSDLALISSSLDTTVRVVFDFMEATPQQDVIMELFQFDVNGTNIHVTADSESSFPRIAELSKKENTEQFFTTYSFLFPEALRRGRSDFLEEFLPHSVGGLLKSNRVNVKSGKSDGEGEFSGLLRTALEKGDRRAIRVIVDCWCAFFASASSEYIHDEEEGRISMPDLILLSSAAPAEFEKLICSIKLIPVKGDTIPPGSYYLYERDLDKKILLGLLPDAYSASSQSYSAVSIIASKAPQDCSAEMHYLYLPLTNAAHMDMLRAYTKVCEDLDSVEIFNSEVGQLVLSYAWRRVGIRAHVIKMCIYISYIIIGTASLLTFTRNKDDPHSGFISYILIIVQLVLDLYIIKEEGLQLAVDPLEYLGDIWNALDFVVVTTNVLANILRLAYWHDTVASKVFLCLTAVVGYFNILYYLRAFEATGPLVSMILKISQDMMYLIMVVMIVLVGFSQAFWVVSEDDAELPFGTIEASLLNSFVFMLGGFDPSAFQTTYLAHFAVALSCIYMLIVSILLLNLLIALMGDSYGSVKEKGLAQWKLEQAQIITEMQGSMSDKERNCTSIVYLRANRAEPESVAENQAAQLDASMSDLRRNMKAVMKKLDLQQESLRQQAELNTLLKEFLVKSVQ